MCTYWMFPVLHKNQGWQCMLGTPAPGKWTWADARGSLASQSNLTDESQMPVRVIWGWPLTSDLYICMHVWTRASAHTHTCWCTNVQNLRPYAVGCNYIPFTGPKKLECTVLCHSVGALKDPGLYQASGLTSLCTTFTSYKTAVGEGKPLPVPLHALCL